MRNWLLGLVVTSLLTFDVAVSEVLEPFSAAFNVQRNIIPLGSLTLKLKFDPSGTAYTYSAHTRPGMLAGLFSRHEVTEQSRGNITSKQIIPYHYIYEDLDEPSEKTTVEFDWNKQSVASTSKEITWSQPIPEGTQDKLSQQLQVRIHLANGEQQISYQVADGGKLKSYLFEVVGEEEIESAYGTYQCLKVERSKSTNQSDYTIWFAPELGYFPIKIERINGGKTYSMVLEELSLL